MKEQRTRLRLEWGEDYHGKSYTDSWSCINERCERSSVTKYGSTEYVFNIAIGVRHNPLKAGQNYSPRDYIITCECPVCFDKFWFHITEESAREVLETKREKEKK